MKILDSRLSAVVAGGAVIALLGAGAGYAANTVRSVDIVDGTIRSLDIKDGTIKTKDLNPKARAELRGQRGPRGLQGAPGADGQDGAQGPQGPQGPAGPSSIVQVSDLDGAWSVRPGDEAGASLTGDGLQLGPFASQGGAADCEDPGADYARVDFDGMNGQPLAALKGLSYRALHVGDTDTEGYGAVPIRVFFDDPSTAGTNDHLTFSPNTQFNKPFAYDVDENEVNEYLVTSGTVRFNDDAGNDPSGELPWDTYLAQKGELTITNINFLGGCSGAQTTNLRQIVRSVKVNGTTYEFGAL